MWLTPLAAGHEGHLHSPRHLSTLFSPVPPQASLVKSQDAGIRILSPLPRPSSIGDAVECPSYCRFHVTECHMTCPPQHLSMDQYCDPCSTALLVLFNAVLCCVSSSFWSNTAPHILHRTPFLNTSNILISLHVSDAHVTTVRLQFSL